MKARAVSLTVLVLSVGGYIACVVAEASWTEGTVEEMQFRFAELRAKKAASVEREATMEEAMARRVAWARVLIERGKVKRATEELELVEAWLKEWVEVDRKRAVGWLTEDD